MNELVTLWLASKALVEQGRELEGRERARLARPEAAAVPRADAARRPGWWRPGRIGALLGLVRPDREVRRESCA